MSTVCQDYGHGGMDPGAVGHVREKDGNLIYGTATTKSLIRNGFNVKETRVSDTYESLSTRVAISNNLSANWFISHHENAGGGHGIEVYCYKFGGKGEKLAREVLKELVAATGLPSRGVKEGNFQVLRETAAPAILIEFGFVDNADDANVISRQGMPDIYAGAIVKALCTVEGKAFIPGTVTPIAQPVPLPKLEPASQQKPEPVPQTIPQPEPEMPINNPSPEPKPEEAKSQDGSKNWYESKTLWVNFVMALAVIAQYVSGKEVITPEIQAAIISAVNMGLRMITKKEIKW
jgi:hypothetical protein